MPQSTALTGQILDDNGNVIGTATGNVLDDNGNPVASAPTPAPSRSAMGTAGAVASGIWQEINPIDIAKGIYSAVTSPVETAKGIGRASLNQLEIAKDEAVKGNPGHAAMALAGAVPLVGPPAYDIEQEIEKGDTAHGIGRAVGFAGTMLAPEAASAAKALKGTAVAEKAANVIGRGVESRMVDVMAPKLGPNKLRLGNIAKDVGPEIAAEPGMGALSRRGLHEKVSMKLQEAEQALDAAATTRKAGIAYPTQPVLDALQDARSKLAAGGSNLATVKGGVVPGPNKVRVQQIDSAIREVQALGKMAPYESLRRIRAAYDDVAKPKYAAAVTPDYVKVQGAAAGAADVTRALRDVMAQYSPETAKANKAYAFWRKADDVLEAADEVERVRPTVGRKIMAGGIGAIAGGASGVPFGHVVGAVVGPLVEHAAATVSEGKKIIVARMLSSVEDALRTGDTTRIATALKRARALNLTFGNAARTDQ